MPFRRVARSPRTPRAAEAPAAESALASDVASGDEAEAESMLPELLQLGAQGGEALQTRVEEEFSKISPEDLSDLHLKASNADDADHAAARAVGSAIQNALHNRMADAKVVLEEWITSSRGDVNVRIRKTLKKLESPLPVLMVIQLNIAQCQEQGDEDKMRVLMHINSVISEELEKKASRVRGLLNKLLRIEDENIRNNLLRHHLTPMEVGPGPDLDGDGASSKLMAALVPPNRLAPAIEQLVKDVDRQMVAVLGPDDDARYETMDRIREVAKQARLVIGDVYGQGDMDQFSADLTPAFHTLMAYKAHSRPGPAPDASAEAPSQATDA